MTIVFNFQRCLFQIHLYFIDFCFLIYFNKWYFLIYVFEHLKCTYSLCRTVSLYFHLGLIHHLMVSLRGLSQVCVCFGFGFGDILKGIECVFCYISCLSVSILLLAPSELTVLCQVVLWLFPLRQRGLGASSLGLDLISVA